MPIATFSLVELDTKFADLWTLLRTEVGATASPSRF
jgi:hypothetical protein